ncbi:hypothetical protein [Nocardia asteroides]|uniref:hypothetical protein n=1 Tax=Nocardia asteroides TaxID=1824 RepID=UPI001E47D68B|nr:hypothetical protein [Nocardia asteroides]UGT56068.1 hypothetical protein LTT85_04040 [Nocardia asteroides]
MATIDLSRTLSRARFRAAPARHGTATAPWHGPLLVNSALMGALVLVSMIGMVVDDRLLLGESVWLKPAKFGLAFALYGLTLAWILRLPHRGRRATWWLGTVFAVTGVLDVGFIALQAARGTFSHFNTAQEPINQIGQQVFASGVPGLFVANLVLAVIISWQKLADRPTTIALKAGLWLAVTGMALGYLMGFTGPQLVRQADGTVVGLMAGHTVHAGGASGDAARDGVGAMPITHWSTTGGDLRIPHFVGLHGIQVLLLLAVGLVALAPRYRWLRTEKVRAALLGVAVLGYFGLLTLVLWQALRGQPLTAPDLATTGAAAALAVLVAGGVTAVYLRARELARAGADPA